MVKEHNQLVVAVMAALDLAVTAGTWVLCYHLRFHWGLLAYLETSPPPMSYVFPVLVVTVLLTLLVFVLTGMYRTRRIDLPAAESWEVLKACAIVWALEVVISYFMYTPRMSGKLQAMFLVVWPVAMIAYRGTARLALRAARRRGRNLRTVAIVGAGRLGQKLLHALRRQRWTGYDISYFVEDRRIGRTLLGVPVRGPIDSIDRIVAAYPVDAVFVALPQQRSSQLAGLLGRLSTEMVDVHVVPDLLSYQFLGHQVRQIGELAVVNLTESPQGGLGGVLKRAFDLVFAAAGLIVLSPLMGAIALWVRCTSAGPSVYRQQRASLGGKRFTILKFRSMVHPAETAGDAVWGAAPNDPRVTPVGRVLRKLSLDELPQLINVLRGDMSLVGPRPERPEFIKRFTGQIPRYILRHHVKAGLTGWAQVHGYRGRSNLRKRIQYDLDYINRWSLGLDVWIIVLTVFRGFVNPRD
ncbi:MAG TPA: undecaprenyl-phosphate glucose phosphotransferase [Phycisphaerae bacterium]|nr:undecaprenyl-phosphate glucose phosphotransferase [Phycisphaerae bacterium]